MARTASRYEERQSTVFLPAAGIVLSVAALIVTALASVETPPLYMLAFVLAVVCLLLFTFSALTVTVGGTTLEWHFRFGFWRKRILLADIASVEPKRIPWWYGIGIRLTPEGWYYGVKGRKAVGVATRAGRKVVIGSRTPERLAEAIRQRAPQQTRAPLDLPRA
jgi:hypothetical protein